MIPKPRIFTPGPTAPLPEAALAEAGPLPHHRSAQFRALLAEVRQGLQLFFNTRRDVVVFTSSGTGGLEAVAAAAVTPGRRVVCVNAGKFGARWAAMARALGADVREVVAPPGQAVTVEQVAAELQAGETDAVFVQGCETSTATLHPVREIAALVRQRPETLLCVDGITWLGAHEARPDEWGLDLVVGASQKALSMAPGLSFVSVSEKAERLLEVRTGAPRYYFDLRRELAAQRAGETAFTPAVSLVAACARALARLRQHGLDALVDNARRLAAMTRAALGAMGLRLLSAAPADSVTAAFAPNGVTASRLLDELQKRHGIVAAEGQDGLRNLVFRLAHLGFYDYIDCIGAIGALEDVLLDLGARFKPGSGLEAAQLQWRGDRSTGVPPG
jgi:aspartate aminotransferase-like enzyme